MTKPLWKTTAIIWTDFDPVGLELDNLAREAVVGDAYCSYQRSEKVEDPEDDEHAPDMEFFGGEEEEI